MQVDYQASSIFINITVSKQKGKINKLDWWPKPEVVMRWQADPKTEFWNRFGPQWWFPDVPLSALRSVYSWDELVAYLRELPDEVRIPTTPPLYLGFRV